MFVCRLAAQLPILREAPHLGRGVRGRGFTDGGNGERYARSDTMKGVPALFALTCIVILPDVTPAQSAPPSAQIARACREEAIKAHPTQLAGSVHGSAQAQRNYFQNCILRKQYKR